jgi:hypothetical protein
MNAAKAMFSTYQDGFVALDKIRRGGKQTVKVSISTSQSVLRTGRGAAGGVREGLKARGEAEMTNKPHAKPPAGTGWPKMATAPATLATPRCGAKTLRCALSAAMPNGRCRMHGGPSTGPRTEAGKAAIRASRTKHGRYSQATIAKRREARAIIRSIRALLRSDSTTVEDMERALDAPGCWRTIEAHDTEG